jgi:hypothetical protein
VFSAPSNAWQQGYGAFSVGIPQVQETVHYIEQQLEHHRMRTFQEEYLAFLKKHGAHFDEKYLWDRCARSYRTLRDGFFLGTLSQALRARLRSVCPYGTWLAAISQQPLAS